MPASPADSLFSKPCQFVMGGVDMESLPPMQYAEVAFAGRSNVGKSSLVNALTGHKTLAKASNTPGRTREINFFLLAEALMLVDLPGYGYASAPKKEVAAWTRLVKAYLAGRPNLARVLMLIDARHGLKEVDLGIMAQLDKVAASYQIVLTKADKIKPAELVKITEETTLALKRHPAAHPLVIATSSETKAGISALREEIAQFAKEKR
jgi:GTP-binding protein